MKFFLAFGAVSGCSRSIIYLNRKGNHSCCTRDNPSAQDFQSFLPLFDLHFSVPKPLRTQPRFPIIYMQADSILFLVRAVSTCCSERAAILCHMYSVWISYASGTFSSGSLRSEVGDGHALISPADCFEVCSVAALQCLHGCSNISHWKWSLSMVCICFREECN